MFSKVSFKLIFDILFYVALINAIGLLILIPIEIINSALSSSLYLGAGTEVIYSIAFVIVAYHLRKTARIFTQDREFKSFNLVKHLKRSGQFLVVLGISLTIKEVFLMYYIEATRPYFQTSSGIYILLIVIGLSFIRLSKMLQLSIKAKQEQDLTI